MKRSYLRSAIQAALIIPTTASLIALPAAAQESAGDIEVIQVPVILLTVNELHNIGVINPQNRHVGAPACAPLFDLLGGGIENSHKRNRT